MRKLHSNVKEVVISVRVEPLSSRSGIVGAYGDGLKVKIKSPPVEGRANRELVDVLSKGLGISRKDVEIISGERSKNKIVRLKGVNTDKIREFQG